jgi:hypothetical protein
MEVMAPRTRREGQVYQVPAYYLNHLVGVLPTENSFKLGREHTSSWHVGGPTKPRASLCSPTSLGYLRAPARTPVTLLPWVSSAEVGDLCSFSDIPS